MAMGSYLSVITLNVNGLNAPTKRQRLAEWIQKHRGAGTLIPSAQRFVWAAKQPLGNAALGPLAMRMET